VRLLDDALREQIRDELIQQKTFRRMEDMTAAAVDWFVENVGLYVSAPEDSPERLTPEQAAQKVRDYARQQGLHYDETPLMSGEELASSEDHPVGAAVDPHDPRRATVAMIVMTSSPQDLFRPMVAENFVTTSRFVFWKTEDRPGYIPGDLDDERVREQVTETWRMLQARERAKARAEALAQRVRDSVEPMSVALGAETVTGTDKGLFLTVTRTGEFSWLSFPGAQRPNPFSFQPPTLQDPLGIQNAGQDFMRTVFNDLKPGQVGVAPNFDRSIFYVVKVLERTPASEQDFDQFRARFLKEPVFDQLFFPSVYQQLALRTMQEYRSDWVTQLWEKHGAQLTRSGNEG
jgi:hypothetical protein